MKPSIPTELLNHTLLVFYVKEVLHQIIKLASIVSSFGYQLVPEYAYNRNVNL